MQSNNVTQSITPQSLVAVAMVNGFLTPEQLILLAHAKLEYLKALYRGQLGYELADETTALPA